MKFWIIHAQEPLPQPSNVPARRLWRSNTIAEMLADRGHQVVRWRSGFSHYEKRHLVSGAPRVSFERHEYQYLDGPSYKHNIGIPRVLHHRKIARDFARMARTVDDLPDLIHVGNVPLELCEQAVRFGVEKKIPVVIDIRDLWPDIYLDLVPAGLHALKPLIRKLLHFSYRSASYAMRHATAITGITEPFVEWGLRLGARKRQATDCVFHMSYPEPAEPASKESADRLHARLGLKGGDFLVCYFGNIGYQSDFQTLLDAARILGNDATVRFVICGNGPKLTNLHKSAAGLGNVVIPGWMDSNEIQQLMRISAVGLLPFKERDNYVLNMPNKFSEYLSGRLVIACGVKGEMAKLVEAHECGFVYPTGDATTLAETLRNLAMAPERVAAMKENSERLFRSQFNCRVVYVELCEYLENMAVPGRS